MKARWTVQCIPVYYTVDLKYGTYLLFIFTNSVKVMLVI